MLSSQNGRQLELALDVVQSEWEAAGTGSGSCPVRMGGRWNWLWILSSQNGRQMELALDLVQSELEADGTGSRSCPVTDFSIAVADPSNSVTLTTGVVSSNSRTDEEDIS
jgi:hypothetical protein